MRGRLKVKWLLGVTVLLVAITALAAKPLVLKGKGTACVLLAYDFDEREKDFPQLNFPDNALLLLKGESDACEPMGLSAEQDGKIHSAAGSESLYVYGAFHIVYFELPFDKFNPFKLLGPDCELIVNAQQLETLVAGAEKRGKEAYRDPVTDDMIKTAEPLNLPELLSRGRFVEYSNVAFDLARTGGLARLRREARSALGADNPIKAACLAAMALKWASSSEPPEVRTVTELQDWVLMARSFRKMKRPLAALIAYDQALKSHRDRTVIKERKDVLAEYRADAKNDSYRPELSEAELELGGHGSIPIPAEELDVVEGGVKANGVYLGDHRDRIVAQCGRPSESLSEVLLYFDHPRCPEAVFISPSDRAYSIRTRRGKTPHGVGIGSKLDVIGKLLGKPDKEEPIIDEDGKPTGTKWIYLKLKIAFTDLTGDKEVDSIDVFNHSFVP